MGTIRSLSKPSTPPRWLLAAGLLALCSLCVANDQDSSEDEPTTVTAAPIYLPHYDSDAWSIVRGSIIESDTSANETTYTIFCPAETPPACDLSLEFPFVIVEGPHTVKFHGTVTSTYTANVECELNGTTAATCSGYSSYKSGYSNGGHTGPTEVSWTSTLSGTDVEWGSLTMAPTPTQTTDPLGVTITENPFEETSIDPHFLPSTTQEGSGIRLVTRQSWSWSVVVASIVAAAVLL